MAWAVPQFEKPIVNKAGRIFISPTPPTDEYSDALVVINNWRAVHAFPLNTFQMNLRRRGRKLDPECLIAQRIKRLSSIDHKLTRFPGMKLSQMQDIGGCRAIVRDVKTVSELVESFVSSDIKHKLATQDDYILNPKPSGYRGVHLVYRYFSDRKSTYNDLKIELQIRSILQHSWATAVEVVGTLVQQALKSSQGEDDWLRFFQLMGSAIALEEGSVTVPTTPSDKDTIKRDLKVLVKSLRPAERLQQYSQMLQVIENSSKRSRYYLLDLRMAEKTINITGFVESESQQATDQYMKIERSLNASEGDEAVLVSVDSVEALRKAYPNYFLDTGTFVEAIKRWCK